MYYNFKKLKLEQHKAKITIYFSSWIPLELRPDGGHIFWLLHMWRFCVLVSIF
jgi:hypothetical protein